MRAMDRKGMRVVRAVAAGLLAVVLAGGLSVPTVDAAGCQLCQKWKKLRAKCWPKKLSGGGMVVCEFRFSQIKPGFTAETPADRESVTYTCDELKAARDVPEPEKARVMREACPPVAGSSLKSPSPDPAKRSRE